jgi:hypothetical protein
MFSFQTKNPHFRQFWRALDWKMTFWNILKKFGIFTYNHFVHFVHIFSGFGIMYQEKSGNPGEQSSAQSSPRQTRS